jgi:hypothetical protein
MEGLNGDEWAPCARGPWCAAVRVVWDGGRPLRLGALCPRAICEDCRAALLTTLELLPRTHTELLTALTRSGKRSDGPKVSGTPERSVPLRLDADTMLRELADTVTRQARLVRDHAGWPAPWWDQVSPNTLIRLVVVMDACDTVARLVDTLIAWDGDGERCTELIRLLGRARRVAGHDTDRTRIPGVCPTCDARGTLTRYDTDPDLLEGVTCGNCRQTHTRGDYHKRVASEIRAHSPVAPDGRLRS